MKEKDTEKHAQLLPAAFEPAWRKMGVTGFCTGVLMMILGIAALA